MGTSGVTLFADDTAADVRRAFIDLLATGEGPEHATEKITSSWAAAVNDPDDGPVFWLALADTQWTYGCLLAEVRSKALEVIDQDLDLARWAGSIAIDRRRAVLVRLREKLLSPQPRRRKPRRRKLPVVLSATIDSPNGERIATTFEFGQPARADDVRAQVMIGFGPGGMEGGGGVFAANCPYDQVRLAWLDNDTLEIVHPTSARVLRRSEETFFRGQVVRIRYRAE